MPDSPRTYGDPAFASQPDNRPGTVTTACILTWVFASLAIAGAALLLLEVTVGRQDFEDEWEKEPDLDSLDVAADSAATAIGVITLVCIVLSVLAIVAAVAAFRRSSAGRISLMVLSGLTALLSLVASLAIVPFLGVIASTVTLILLFTSSANAWFTSGVKIR
jgi:hypothetical protein